MKRLIIGLVILIGLSISVYAQTGMTGSQQGQARQGMTMGEGQQMPMMQMCMPMMQQMMSHGMMMQDMQQMMMDMLNMQEKMMMGVKADEKKKMMKDITQMKEKMQKMMSMCKCMMSGMMAGMTGQQSDNLKYRLNCVEQWLKKAIDLHEVHIKDPKTATEASQMEMMDHMKKAYDCIAGKCCEMGEKPSKEPESKEIEKGAQPKTEEHKH